MPTAELRARALALLGAEDASFAEAGGCTVVLAGKLHERARSAASDAEAVLDAYLERGEDALRGLRGEFAVAVWDRRTETLLAARDPLGVHPLFYADVAGSVLLSTSIDALLAAPGVSRELNVVAIADALCHRWPDSTETYFEAIRRVPPGHALRAQNGSRREVFRYWNPAPPGEPVRWLGREDLERFEDVMTQAVARCMDAQKAGIFLSGGLDSVSVAAVAADYTRRNGLEEPLALSLVFPADECNEEVVQRGVAQDLGLEQVLLPFGEALSGEGLLAPALELSAGWPSPLANVWYPAYRSLAAQGAARGCGVILTGGGGDEWLAVTPYLAADLLRKGNIPALLALWQNMVRSFGLPRRDALRSVFWTFGARPLVAGLAADHAPAVHDRYRRRRAREGFPEWISSSSALRGRLDARTELLPRLSNRDGFYFREGQLSLDHVLVSMEMEEVHEIGRRSGVPLRMPFWEADLVDFLYRTPPELLNEGGRSKGLVRRMLDERFPELNFGRHKKVLAVDFFRDTMLREGPETWRRMGGASALEKIGVVDKTRLESFVADVFGGRRPGEVSRVWNLMGLEVWVRSRLHGGEEVNR
jgi:asparagine synthase (glutamine-hydrolysing)